ncbi:MAG: TolC family protein [Opitutales bacterium]
MCHFKRLLRVGSACLACLCASLVAAAQPDEPPPDPLSVPWILDRVAEQNLTVLLNQTEVEEALQETFRQRAGLLPAVSVEASQTRSQFVNVGRGFGDIGSPPPSSRFDARLAASLTLFDATVYANWRLAKLGYRISELGHDSLLQDVQREAVRAFFVHLRNRARLEAIDANIERSRQLLELARNQFEAGVATSIDVTRAEVALARDEQSRLQQESVVLSSELRLKTLLNLDLDTPIQTEVPDIDVATLPTGMPQPDLKAVLERRPDYKQAEQLLEQAILTRRAARFQRLPRISLFGDYGLASAEAFDGREDETWAAGITLSFPLFEGLSIPADTARAQARVRAREFAIADLRNTINRDLLIARQELESRYAQIAAARKTARLRDRELELARARFRSGTGDNRDIVDAQNGVAQADDQVIEAVYFYNLARLDYARALGEVRRVTRP